jgi:hypothetical protein
MALEDRFSTRVDTAIDALTSRVKAELQTLSERLAGLAAEERETAVHAARDAAAAAAADDTRRQLDEAEARGRTRARDAETAAVTRLLESISMLDSAATLSDVLDALARASALEASRAAVLVIRHDRLLGWKLAGFGAGDAQPKAIDLDLTENSLASLAIRAVRPMTTSEPGVLGLPFAALPADRLGLAVPVIVGGRAVAIVYADSGAHDANEPSAPPAWPAVIEILARHASRCLEALTVQKTTSAAAPRFWVPGAARPSAAV